MEKGRAVCLLATYCLISMAFVMPISALTIMQAKSIPYTFIRVSYFYLFSHVLNDLHKYYSYPRVVQGYELHLPKRLIVQLKVALFDIHSAYVRDSSLI